MRDSITAQEFHGLKMGKKTSSKSSKPTVKAPQISKEGKQRLIPYSNQTPQRRDKVSNKYPA